MTWEFNVDEQIAHIIDWIKGYFVENGPDSKAIVGISGGKDSSIVAALCVRALGKDRVIGVKMPQGVQYDIDYADRLIDHLGIESIEVNIGDACEAAYDALTAAGINLTPQITSNLPARIRMTTLYAVAAERGGRVANTCNRSEDYVGYSTKYGDGAGDFAPLAKYTVREVLLIGSALGLPEDLVYKTPADGLCGKTDEDNLGFTYEDLDAYILEHKLPDFETYLTIRKMHDRSKHKLRYMPVCNPKMNDTWSF